VVILNLKIAKPDVEALARILLGPGGTMRAPVMRCGKALIVGYDEDLYQEMLGQPEKDAGREEATSQGSS
jgi:arsenate reductase-like glutaredoxin family protein